MNQLQIQLMKKTFFNKTGLVLSLILGMALTSCLKDKGYQNGEYGSIHNTGGGKYVSIRGAGLANFSKSSLQVNSTKSDTIRYDVIIDLDYATPSTSPIVVTLGLDNAAIATYNAANGKNFQPVTSSMVKILNPTVTIPAGERTAKTTLEVYQNKFDPSKSYIIPLTILTVDGATVSSNLNTRYVNIIGNPLAGTYSWDFRRFNTADTTGAPAAGSFVGTSVSINPLTETSLLLPESYMQTFVDPGAGIVLNFTNTAGVFSNFKVSLSAKTISDIAAGGFTLAAAPVLVGFKINGTSANGYSGTTFRTYMSLINSSGGTRTVIDNFTKQ